MQTEYQVIEQGLISDIATLSRLNIVDFGRRNGAPYGSTYAAMQAFEKYAVNSFRYTIIGEHLNVFPIAPGWKEWHHIGDHPRIGRAFWNMVHYSFPGSTLEFSDAPDFSGTLLIDDEECHVEGDIGQCSPMAFWEGIKMLNPGDFWITVYSERRYALLEASYQHPLWVSIYMTKMERDIGTDVLVGQPHIEDDVEWFESQIQATGYRANMTEEEFIDWSVSQGFWTLKRAALAKARLLGPKIPSKLYQAKMF